MIESVCERKALVLQQEILAAFGGQSALDSDQRASRCKVKRASGSAKINEAHKTTSKTVRKGEHLLMTFPDLSHGKICPELARYDLHRCDDRV